MPQAESHHTRIPSRRDVIRGGGKVAATLAVLAHAATAAIPVPAALTVGDDAEILALGREWAHLEAITGSDEVIVRAVAKIMDIAARISDLKATTFSALAVKLRIAADPLLPLADNDDHSYDQMNLVSALADVERMAKEARA